MHFTAATAALILAFASTGSALPVRRAEINIPFMNEDCLRTCAVSCVSETGMDLETCATTICACFDGKAYIDATPFEFHQFGAHLEDPLTGLRPGQFTKAQKLQLGLVEGDKKKKVNNNKKVNNEEVNDEKVDNEKVNNEKNNNKEANNEKASDNDEVNPVPPNSVDWANDVKGNPAEISSKIESPRPTMTKRPAREVEVKVKETQAPVAEKEEVEVKEKVQDETRDLEDETRDLKDETRVLEDEARDLKDNTTESV